MLEEVERALDEVEEDLTPDGEGLISFAYSKIEALLPLIKARHLAAPMNCSLARSLSF